MDDEDVKKLFRTVKEDLSKAKNSLNKVLTSNKIISNLRHEVKNPMVLYPNTAIYLKIPIKFREVPLTLLINEVGDDSGYRMTPIPAFSCVYGSNNPRIAPNETHGRRGSLVNLKTDENSMMHRHKIVVYMSETWQYPDELEHDKYHGKYSYTTFASNEIYISITCQKFKKIDFYFCFGNQRIKMFGKRAKSMEELKDTDHASIGRIANNKDLGYDYNYNHSRLRSKLLVSSYKSKVEETVDDKYKQKELFGIIKQIRSRRASQNISGISTKSKYFEIYPF